MLDRTQTKAANICSVCLGFVGKCDRATANYSKRRVRFVSARQLESWSNPGPGTIEYTAFYSSLDSRLLFCHP